MPGTYDTMEMRRKREEQAPPMCLIPDDKLQSNSNQLQLRECIAQLGPSCEDDGVVDKTDAPSKEHEGIVDENQEKNPSRVESSILVSPKYRKERPPGEQEAEQESEDIVQRCTNKDRAVQCYVEENGSVMERTKMFNTLTTIWIRCGCKGRAVLLKGGRCAIRGPNVQQDAMEECGNERSWGSSISFPQQAAAGP